MDLFSNPELIRNMRAQLRWGRMISVAAICAVLSLVSGYALATMQSRSDTPGEWGMRLLQLALGTQALALVLGGSIACLNSVHREKEMNTFDFQRVTRLTPWELAIGKLFGAPIVVYFAVLCLIPAALVGAVVGGARPTMVLAAYTVLLLGSLTAHSFALLISLFHQRGTNTAAVLLLIFLLWGFGIGMGQRIFLELGSLSPFFAVTMVDQASWQLSPISAGQWGAIPDSFSRPDVFFGMTFHHVPGLIVLYMLFTVWFLLAVARNLKRDPSVYELYTPNQSLGFLCFVNVLMLGFFRWGSAPLGSQAARSDFDIQSIFLGTNLSLFTVLGLTLLRNRDQVRRRLREMGNSASSWLAASWPAPYLLAGMLLVGLAAIGMIQFKHDPRFEWDLLLALFRVGLVLAWLIRDLLFLQWMNLTRLRRPLVMGCVYLMVFYFATTIIFISQSLYDSAGGRAKVAFFAPTTVFNLSLKDWSGYETAWVVALVCQVASAAVLIYLQRQKLMELKPAPAVAPAAESPLPSIG